MPSSQSDHILRLVEELGAVLRRLREKLAHSLRAAPEIMEEAERSQQQLFGALWPTLRSVDAATAASLVTEPRQLELWIGLIQLEADASRLAGNHVHAARLAQRANELDRVLRERGET